MFGSGFGTAWAHLLVGRNYVLPDIPKGVSVPRDPLPLSVRYAVGQPMGALSSWAMLALTHHFIIQWAAWRSNVAVSWGSFQEYAVLGDDVVIANGKVATEYLIILRMLGVEVGLAKSLISRKGVLEFAKRYFVRGQDCSPMPFKEVLAAIHDFEFSTEFVRKYNLGARSSARLLGYGYKVLGRLGSSFSKIPGRLRTLGI